MKMREKGDSREYFPVISDYEHTQHIFFELASEHRLQILFKLHYEKTKLARLARELDVTMQEVHRNLNRLFEAGLIEKDSSGNFSLSTFGNIIIRQISTFSFLSTYQNYFSEHIAGDIPLKFIYRIGALNKCEFIDGLVAVMEKWKKMYEESEEYICAMLPQIPLELIEAILPRIKSKKLKFSYILPQNALVPRKRTDLLKQVGYQDLLRSGEVERRMIDRIQVAVVLNEKQATVIFPNSKGLTDMTSMFYSNGSVDREGLFHDWCLDFFRYNWYNSKSFDERKLVEV
jgi:predicted transcriptional regulator